MTDQTTGGLLEGLRVLDLSIWRPGPYTTQLLCELGADVIKIEPPGGDPMRTYVELFDALNARKRSIMLDLKSDAGRRRCLELAGEADVVVEGFRPGVAKRLGVDDTAIREVNPSVIYCSLSGLGQVGPLAEAPGHDINFQAWAGGLAPNGGEPIFAPLPIADLAGGMAGALAISAAVAHRARTGGGERIDLAMTDVLATWTGAATPRSDARPADSNDTVVPGYGIFSCVGGAVTIGIVSEDHFWEALCRTLGLAREDATFAQRMAEGAQLQAALRAAVAPRDRDDLVRQLLAAGVPVAPVVDRAGMLASPHLRERQVVNVDGEGFVSTGHPVRFERHPAAVGGHAPALDQHAGAGFGPRPAGRQASRALPLGL